MMLQQHKSLNINSYRKERKRSIGKLEDISYLLSHYNYYLTVTHTHWIIKFPSSGAPFCLSRMCVECENCNKSRGDEKTCQAIPLNTIRRYIYWLSARIIVFVRFYFFTGFHRHISSFCRLFLSPHIERHTGLRIGNLILLPLVFFGLFSITIKSVDVY